MAPLLAIADLRFRGGVAARMPWLVPASFAGALLVARWIPGTGLHARAAAADSAALAAAALAALLAVLILAATAFAGEVRTTSAHALLSAPVSRAAVIGGGVLGHAAFGFVLALGLGASAALGLDVGGLGTRARDAVRPLTAADLSGNVVGGEVLLSREREDLLARFEMPDGVGPGDVLRVRFAPRGRVETGYSAGGELSVALGPPGLPGRPQRVRYKAGSGVAFDTAIAVESLRPGERAELVVRRESGEWALRFLPGSIEVGGARELFAWNVVKAVVCLLPLLVLAAATGAAASARLAGAAALPLVLFLVLVVAGRRHLEDGARLIVAMAEEAPDHDHDHDHGDGHAVEVTAAQVALARTTLTVLPALPDTSDFWRFDELAGGRAVTSADMGRALRAGLLPCVAMTGIAWLLVRRREIG